MTVFESIGKLTNVFGGFPLVETTVVLFLQNLVHLPSVKKLDKQNFFNSVDLQNLARVNRILLTYVAG